MPCGHTMVFDNQSDQSTPHNFCIQNTGKNTKLFCLDILSKCGIKVTITDSRMIAINYKKRRQLFSFRTSNQYINKSRILHEVELFASFSLS